MSKKVSSRPSLSRRPAGFTQDHERAVRASITAMNVSLNGINAVLDGDYMHADYESAMAWSSRFSAFDIKNAWWCLAKDEKSDATAAAVAAAEELYPEAFASVSVSGDEIAKSCDRLRERYIYASFRDMIWDRRARDWITTTALSNNEAHSMPTTDDGKAYDAFKLLRRDTRATRVHNERYIPGCHDEVVAADGVEWLNTWRAPDLKPAKGDAMPMLNHILYICNGNREQAKHVTDWLAYCVQNPGAKIAHALLIISPAQGVGKDTLALAVSRILGETNTVFLDDSAIEEGRGEFLLRSQLVIVPEIMTGDRKDIANKLKPLITQPVIRINEKNVRPYYAKNHANFLFFSNHENAAHIEKQDRRHFVVICNQAPKDTAYYDALYDYIRGDGLAGFAWFLQNRDLSAFNPSARPPETEDKTTVQKATRGAVEAWLEDAYESADAPFDNDVVNLREALEQIASTKGAPRIALQQMAAFLKSRGGADLGPKRLPQKGMKRLWAIRHGERIASMPVYEIEDLYKGRTSIDFLDEQPMLKIVAT